MPQIITHSFSLFCTTFQLHLNTFNFKFCLLIISSFKCPFRLYFESAATCSRQLLMEIIRPFYNSHNTLLPHCSILQQVWTGLKLLTKALLFCPVHARDDVVDEDVGQRRKLLRQDGLVLIIVRKLQKHYSEAQIYSFKRCNDKKVNAITLDS